MNIFSALERSKNRYPDKEAIVFGSDRITYAQLYEQAYRLSSALKEIANLHKGERVALFLPNRPEFVASYYAVVRLGAIAVSLNVMLKRDEVKFILNDCEAKIVITTSELLDQVPDLDDIPSVKKILCVNRADRPGVVALDTLVSSVT